MSISIKSRLKVSSVSSVQDPEGHENVRITFVEIHTRSPMVAMMPQNAPKELSSVVFQVQQGLQKVLPRGLASSQYQKIVLVLTPEELEAFNIKPYPNQIYEVAISDGSLIFKKIKI